MKTYLIAILISIICVITGNYFFAGFNFIECSFITLYGVLIMVLIDALVAIAIHEVPKLFFKKFLTESKFYNYTSFPFKTYKFEKKFYQFVRIRKWKDLLPNKMGMDKSHIQDKNSVDYLSRFLIEGCIAETLHIISALVSPVFIFVVDCKYLSITLPVTMVNFILQILPVMVQRYNRPKIALLLRKNMKVLQINKEQQKI